MASDATKSAICTELDSLAGSIDDELVVKESTGDDGAAETVEAARSTD
jgi:hypothetical protein